MSSDRIFRPLLWLLIAAGAFFGLATLIAPATFASLTGFAGTDLFTYRLAGAATFAYAAGLAAGSRASWAELRIPIASTLVFNAASIFACVLAIIAGGVQPMVFVILLASIVFTYCTAQLLRQPPMLAAGKARAELERPIAQWIFYLFAIGVAAAAVFGLGPLLLGGQFGVIVGAAGNDSFVYRQAGAATLGAAIGGYLVLRSRRWSAARIPALMAVTFNGLSVIAALIEIANDAQPVAYLILAAAAFTTVGMALALYRRGR
ncbi:MAG: hypothetical protein QOI92_467 [Chloroflexota bacterium]|jgi:hypothetical protein|nr:hypothetical protein [Chloroflexota bacterium]